jgi:hypothetical protein
LRGFIPSFFKELPRLGRPAFDLGQLFNLGRRFGARGWRMRMKTPFQRRLMFD